MPLTRGMIVGYDVELMTLRFTMVDPSTRIVDCAISGARWTTVWRETLSRPGRSANLVSKHRETIEELASPQFDARASARPVLVEIFAKHIRGRQNRSRCIGKRP